jgi:uncharacterized protein YchJ
LKIRANEICPCGSGQKYKRCCANNVDIWSLWHTNINAITKQNGLDSRVSNAFFTTLKFLYELNWKGACHATSAILYIICRELGHEPRLCTGVISTEIWSSSHSWVELNGKMYDVSCYFPVNNTPRLMPVFHGKELDTMDDTKTIYGNSIESIDGQIDFMLKKNLTDFMEALPDDLRGASLWQALDNICLLANIDVFDKSVSLSAAVEQLRNKYENTYWELCNQATV